MVASNLDLSVTIGNTEFKMAAIKTTKSCLFAYNSTFMIDRDKLLVATPMF